MRKRLFPYLSPHEASDTPDVAAAQTYCIPRILASSCAACPSDPLSSETRSRFLSEPSEHPNLYPCIFSGLMCVYPHHRFLSSAAALNFETTNTSMLAAFTVIPFLTSMSLAVEITLSIGMPLASLV